MISSPDRGGRATPVLLMLVSVISLQCGAAVATRLFPIVGAAGASALRLTIAAAVLLVVTRPAISRWSWQQRRFAVLLGLALAGMNGAFYEAISRIPLGAAVTIEFLGPLGLAAALSRRVLDALWVLLALVGVVLLGTRGSGDATTLSVTGVLFALVAALFWAAYIITGARVAGGGLGVGGLAVSTVLAAALTLPMGVATGGTELFTPPVLMAGVGVALLASVIPYSCEIAALKRLPRRTFSVLLALEPAAAAAAGVVVLSQRLTSTALFAIALVSAAAIGATVTAGSDRATSSEGLATVRVANPSRDRVRRSVRTARQRIGELAQPRRPLLDRAQPGERRLPSGG